MLGPAGKGNCPEHAPSVSSYLAQHRKRSCNYRFTTRNKPIVDGAVVGVGHNPHDFLQLRIMYWVLQRLLAAQSRHWDRGVCVSSHDSSPDSTVSYVYKGW